MATQRFYCTNLACHFGITIRFDPEEVGNYWIMGESYDPFKMSHTHELNPPPVVEQKVNPIVAPPRPDEERIESDEDSYGDENMEFDEPG